MGRFRVRTETRERMRDCSKRHPVTIADITRQAATAYTRRIEGGEGVNIADYLKQCTRDNSVVITAASVPKLLPYENETVPPIDAVVNWYLDLKDNGKVSRVKKRMSPRDCRTNPDGSITYLGGA